MKVANLAINTLYDREIKPKHATRRDDQNENDITGEEHRSKDTGQRLQQMTGGLAVSAADIASSNVGSFSPQGGPAGDVCFTCRVQCVWEGERRGEGGEERQTD